MIGLFVKLIRQNRIVLKSSNEKLDDEGQKRKQERYRAITDTEIVQGVLIYQKMEYGFYSSREYE